MPKYMILIYGDEERWAAMSRDERRQLDEAHRAFAAAAGSAVLDGQELEPTSAATTLRADPAGPIMRTDGPFAETKEVVGGYYLLEAAGLDDVVALASRLHEVSAGHGRVEIRPVVDHGRAHGTPYALTP